MEKELVIKVTYRGTLRRFSVLFNGNGSLELDMAGLRTKIFNMFSIAPEVDHTLAYHDEDGDWVTLVDDADLYYAIKLRLNPLRMLIYQKPGSARVFHPSGSTTPQTSFPNTSVGCIPLAPLAFAPVLPSPSAPSISQVSRDLASNAPSSTKAVTSGKPPLFCSDHPGTYIPIAVSKLSSKAKDLTITNNRAPSSSRTVNTSDPQNVAKVDVPQSTAKVDTSFPQLFSFNNGKIPQKENNGYPSANPITAWGSPSPSAALQRKNSLQLPVAKRLNDSVRGKMVQNASNTDPAGFMHPQRMNGVRADLSVPHLVKPSVASQNIHSVSGQMGRSVTRPTLFMPPGRTINGNEDTMGDSFHRGVCCDGCGMHPIVGPRYKSKVKVDYDLCGVCFVFLGNEADYTRLDHPICYNPSRFPKLSPYRMARSLRVPDRRRMSSSRSLYQPKLDSQFIKDVSIVDGTLMPPSTSFTKIWRMHNNGAVSWPRGTQLVWMGGDRLNNLSFVELEVPDEGCLVGMDLDIAIVFTAPELPGHYGSYWRMAVPSGDKFGECIWVVIQVDASLRDTEHGIQNLNLNLPPDSVDLKREIIDLNDEPVDASPQNPNTDKLDAELGKSVVNENKSKEKEALVDNSFSIPPKVPTVESLLVDIYASPESARVPDVQTLSGDVSDRINLEQSLLMDLEDMGFKEIDLNREILRANHYDLDRSLDDLCKVPNLDLMLEELQQMGFPDKDANRWLLIKNGGSIKGAVKDLIAAEKSLNGIIH